MSADRAKVEIQFNVSNFMGLSANGSNRHESCNGYQLLVFLSS